MPPPVRFRRKSTRAQQQQRSESPTQRKGRTRHLAPPQRSRAHPTSSPVACPGTKGRNACALVKEGCVGGPGIAKTIWFGFVCRHASRSHVCRQRKRSSLSEASPCLPYNSLDVLPSPYDLTFVISKVSLCAVSPEPPRFYPDYCSSIRHTFTVRDTHSRLVPSQKLP